MSVLSNEEVTVTVHLHVYQRNARQRITVLSGLPDVLNLQLLQKNIKKKFCCGGTIKVAENGVDKSLQFTGDQRQEIAKFLVDEGIAEEENISIHGYRNAK